MSSKSKKPAASSSSSSSSESGSDSDSSSGSASSNSKSSKGNDRNNKPEKTNAEKKLPKESPAPKVDSEIVKLPAKIVESPNEEVKSPERIPDTNGEEDEVRVALLPDTNPLAVAPPAADEVEEGECDQPDEDVKPILSSIVLKTTNVPRSTNQIDSTDFGRNRKYEGRRREEERRRRDRSVSHSRSRSRERRRDQSADRSRRDRDNDRQRDYDRNRGRDRYEDRSRRNRDRSRTPDKSGDAEIKEEPEENKDPEVIPRRQQRTVDMLTSRTGGAYIPPARLRMLQAEITDKSSAAYQRIAWEALKKSIHGYINKVNVDNIGIITRELLKENIVRGRGLLSKSIIQAQAASITFTHVYAALVSVINSKFPNIGELLLKRLVIQFKRGFRRNDKTVCLSASRFIAHLVNQRVAHEILALEILTLLVETPTDDSVEVAIAFLKESGMKLQEVSSKGVNAIFEMLKNILHEGRLDKRVQYMIEVVYQVRKDGFKDHLAVQESLELVEEDDQFTHLIMLDEATDSQDVLNVYKFDSEYQENEQKYKGLCKELLGSDGSSSEDSGSGSGSDEDSSEDEEAAVEAAKQEMIIDQTETNLVALRRTIYLTIHSSLDYEECAHKLMKMELKPGQEMELCHMFLDCCAEQRTYEKFYGLLAQRFCNINKIYIPPFEEIFKDTYSTTHRLDTNRLRNVSKFFAHLLFTDAIGWDVFECIRLNEDDTTSSSRIFIKILFQELAEYMGLGKLNARLKDAMIQESFAGLFPRDNPRNTRFAVNFFTSIGLGGLTDELREHLKNVPKLMTPIVAPEDVKVDSSSSSSSSDSSSDSSSSDSSDSSSDSSDSSSDSDSSDDGKKKKKKKQKKATKVQKKRKDDGKKNKQIVDKKDSRKNEDRKRKENPEDSRKPRRDETEERDRKRRDDKPGRRDKEDRPDRETEDRPSKHSKRDANGKPDRKRDESIDKIDRKGSKRNEKPAEVDRKDRKRHYDDKPRSRGDRYQRSRSADGYADIAGAKSVNPEPDVSYWGRKVDYESDVESKRRRRDGDQERSRRNDDDGNDRKKTKRSISGERG